MENNFYIVEAKCGHVGRKNCIIKAFAIIAESKKNAARNTIKIPRVKHDHKDAIVSVTKVSFEEYLEITRRNEKDLYFRCKSKQEQSLKCIDLYDEIISDSYFYEEEMKYDRLERISYLKKKQKSLKKEEKYIKC